MKHLFEINMALAEHNIYAIPSGDRFGKAPNELFLIYAPLSGNMLMADTDTVGKLNDVLKGKESNEDVCQLMNLLQDTSETQIDTIQHPKDYQVLYVLPNFICNFSCSYCYSAKGRSKKELSQYQLKSAIDYFVDKDRGQKNLKITFAGGGEPMMSWKLIKFGIEYASTLAEKQGIDLYFGLITNGSILNKDILDTLSRCQVIPRISFEILEEIQNKQREQYDKVCRTIDELLENKILCEVRSMITPDNVMRMEEMVKEMAERFPAINCYYFDPITDAVTFSDPKFTAHFYKTYNQSFIKARELAKSQGAKVKNAVLRSLDTVVERYCNGEFCLTPEGTISICLEVSSPEEDNYQQHIYGVVENDSVTIDTEKFHFLKEKEMAQQNPSCQTCFIRWNCGGGCMANNTKYTKEVLEVICESNRDLSLTLLLERLDEEYKEENGMTLVELINNYTE
jgi:radical SAM protein with 4Fe4S-binding SPASM domain